MHGKVVCGGVRCLLLLGFALDVWWRGVVKATSVVLLGLLNSAPCQVAIMGGDNGMGVKSRRRCNVVGVNSRRRCNVVGVNSRRRCVGLRLATGR